MSLPVLADLKAYLRVQTSAEDAALTAILAAAGATVRAYLDRPIEQQSKTYTIEDRRQSSLAIGGLKWNELRDRSYLRIHDAPVASLTSITDADGTALDVVNDVRLELATGMIRANPGVYFRRFPYVVVAVVGLATRSDYASVVEPAISQAVLDIASDLYRRRNPAATGEHAGGGIGVNYGRADESLPIRALDLIAPYRRPSL